MSRENEQQQAKPTLQQIQTENQKRREIENALMDGIWVIRDYVDSGLNLAKGRHHGIGYLGNDLVLFKSVDEKSIVTRKITLKRAIQWLVNIQRVEQKADDMGMQFSSFTWDLRASICFFRQLKAAI